MAMNQMAPKTVALPTAGKFILLGELNEFLSLPEKVRKAAFEAHAKADDARPAAIEAMNLEVALAKNDRAAAAQELFDARAEAEATRVEARNESDRINGEAREAAAVVASNAQTVRKDADEYAARQRRDMATEQSSLTARAAALERTQNEAATALANAQAREEEAAKALAKYNGLMQSIAAVQAQAKG